MPPPPLGPDRYDEWGGLALCRFELKLQIKQFRSASLKYLFTFGKFYIEENCSKKLIPANPSPWRLCKSRSPVTCYVISAGTRTALRQGLI